MTLEMLLENEEFRKQVEEAADVETIIALFASNGVTVTEEELQAIVTEVTGEMDVDSLDNVAGGLRSPFIRSTPDPTFILTKWLMRKLTSLFN